MSTSSATPASPPIDLATSFRLALEFLRLASPFRVCAAARERTTPEPAPTHDGIHPPPESTPDDWRNLWQEAGSAVMSASLVGARAAQGAGASIATAVQAIDPDLRMHLLQLPLVGLTGIMPGDRTIVALPDDGYRPVVFAHGLGGRPGNFALMRAYFASRGRRRTYSVAFGPSTSIEVLALELQDAIRAIIEVNNLPPGTKVDLVAHSMGGVVARLALDDAETAARVANLVTLGTPHRGTYLARFASTHLTHSLRPGSTVLARLCEGAPGKLREGMPHLVSMWSRGDLFMLPPENALVDGAENIEMPSFTHYSFLLTPESWRAVYDSLLRNREPDA